MSASPVAWVAVMCVAEVLSMTAFAAFPTLIPAFRAEWGLSNTEAGWISGVYFAGYVAAVAVLTALTDRIDARRIYLACLALGALGAAGFAFTAEGVWSATAWRVVQGVAIAGTYMPGLKALTDVVPARIASRATAFYTSSFGVGASLSYYLSGVLGAAFGWQRTFALCALGPATAIALAAWMLRPSPPRHDRPSTRLLDFRPVLANRPAVGFTLAYTAHNAELFAYRSWIVAFLVFSQSHQAPGTLGLGISAATAAALLNLLGMPASVLGNEIAGRVGRQRTVIAIMTASAGVGLVFGFLAPLPYWVVLAAAVVFVFTITGESATVTAGVVAVAEPRYKGTTMAMYSVIGFAGAFIGPLVFGAVLDLAGGQTRAHAWGIAFAAMAVLLLAGPAAIARFVGLRRTMY